MEGGGRNEKENRDKTKIGYEPYSITECRSDVAKRFACRVFGATPGRGDAGPVIGRSGDCKRLTSPSLVHSSILGVLILFQGYVGCLSTST